MRRTALLLLLAFCFTSPSEAQEVTERGLEQVIRSLSPERAARMYKALGVEGGALYEFREETGNSHDDLMLGLRWEPGNTQKSESGWSIRGRLQAAIVKNPNLATALMLRSSLRYGIGLFSNFQRTADMKFIYDKIVHVRYRRQGGELRITLDGHEEHGAFNMTVTETAQSSFEVGGGGGFGLSSRSLSVDVRAEGTQVTVVAAGLPYVVRPVVEVRSHDRGDYLTVKWGLIWESRVSLEASVNGVTDETRQTGKLKLGWGETSGEAEVEVTGYARRSPFQSHLTMQAEGDGLEVALLYDERVPHRAYDLVARANQRWHVHVAGSPIVQAGSVQEERSTPIGKKSIRPFSPFSWFEVEMPWLHSWSPGEAPGGAPNMSRPLRVERPRGLVDEQARWGRIHERYCPHRDDHSREQAPPGALRGFSDSLPGRR